MNSLYIFGGLSYTFSGATYLVLTGTLTDLMLVRYGYSYDNAKDFNALVQFSQIFFMPVLAVLIHNYGKKSLTVALSGITSMLSLGVMILTPEKPMFWLYPNCLLISLYYSMLTSSVFFCIAQPLSIHSTTIGLSIVTFTHHLVAGIIPYIIGNLAIDRTPHSYQKTLYLIFGNTVLSSIIGIILFLLDYFGEQILHKEESDPNFGEYRDKKNLEFLLITKNNDS